MFDGQNDILREKSGIDLSRSPDRMREYLHSLNGVLRQELPLPNPTPIQELTWKLGRDVREVSNPEWFSDFADAVLDYFDSSLESYSADVEGEGHCKYVMDLDSYTRMRLRNTGGSLCNICVELSNNVLLSAEIREHPVVQQLTKCLWYYNAYLNDIYSYSKEQDEPHSRNLIMVFMRSESMSLPEAAWKAVNLTNAIARDFMELETHLPVWEDEQKAYVLHRYVQGMKEFMSGTLYFHSLSKRYRLRESPFPELRDVNIPVRAKAEHFKGV
ncbi:hypothetical protein KC19_11G107800 [Ceratodon purpureus]|uniref:Terpene synthase n=1 Tax=Ceratodon purpureus TaxID=3225 RepID=A0A8T0GFT1_CERPU|nr:hypothetical protein KC19_11G107800 [Ceratodon purpureus]